MGAARCIHKHYNRQRPSVESAAQIQLPSFLSRTAACLFLLSLSSLAEVRADDPWELNVSEQELKEIADGALTLMSFQVLPDLTTSSLSIQKASSDDPGIWQTTFGGKFTVSKSFPLYLEGTLGYSRYDPDFIASNGEQEQSIPVKWNSLGMLSGTGRRSPPAISALAIRILPIAMASMVTNMIATSRVEGLSMVRSFIDDKFSIYESPLFIENLLIPIITDVISPVERILLTGHLNLKVLLQSRLTEVRATVTAGSDHHPA